MVKTIPLAEAGRQIQEIVRQAETNDDVFLLIVEKEPRAALLSRQQYESILARLKKLEDALTQIGLALSGVTDTAVMLPTPGGDWRPFRPIHPPSPRALALLREAAQVAGDRREWTHEMTVTAGEISLARAQAHALAAGNSIDDERETVEGD
ncbi:MAG: type II toxin-antitoxin system Phd/YefM family antitoxin [Chloroflexi bacterium]|nr:type II toxin-antitoxin system Phd/YefM family antitoxin [Chloroflexota bacterium]